MKNKILKIAVLVLALSIFLQVPAFAYSNNSSFDYPEYIEFFVEEYDPWFYYKQYLNASSADYAEAKLRSSDEFAAFTWYDDGSYLYSKPDEEYMKPWSNGPEASDRTIYLEHGKTYDSVGLFYNKDKEATQWVYYYYCDKTVRSSDYFIEFDGWAGHRMDFEIYFRYPGMALLQIIGDGSGDMANILIIIS